MAKFINVSSARTERRTVTDGTNAAGEQVRLEMRECVGITYVQRFVNGIGVDTEQFRGRTATERAEAAMKKQAAEFVSQPAPAFVLGALPAEVKPVAEQPTRQRGVNRPDDETPVWEQGGVAVVMVQGREFRYDLRRGDETLDSVKATRNWRAERKAIIAQAEQLIVAPAA